MMPHPLVVSITSLPSRVSKMRPALESLLSGAVVPDRILIALPSWSIREESEYHLPDFLKDGDFRRGIIEVVPADRDWGPGTKLLGALPALKEPCCLVIADDDVSYGPDFLRRLSDAQASDHASSFSYFTYRTHGLTVGQGCDGLSFWSPNLAGVEEFARRYVTGTKLMFHDDLWISFYLMSVGVRIRSLQNSLNGELIYEQVHETNTLRHLAGDLSRETLNREGVRTLLKIVPLSVADRVRIRARDTFDRYVHGLAARAAGYVSRRLPSRAPRPN